MKYSALIRKLVKTSEEAIWQKKDVATFLKERCVIGIDVIRQTLMSTVCDPRFRFHIGAVSNWSKLAREQLESFASRLENISGLTEEIALSEMNSMLTEWFEDVMYIIDRQATEQMAFVTLDQSSYSDNSIKRALDEFVNGKKLEEKGSSLILGWSGEKTKDPLGIAGTDSSDDDSGELGANKDDGEEGNISNDNNTNEGAIGKGAGYNREIEDRFLRNVPPSLIELARRIGRSANLEGEPSGSFYSASKSDIAGITTGNNLNCMLPSELALMASPVTEDIFYKNYVTSNLQLFASQSHSGKSKKHHEGPIIICLDTSSSMNGEPIIVAKALTFAVCIIAQRKKRKVIVVKYSESHEAFYLHDICAQRRDLQDFLSVGEAGGNNENEMFKWLFTDILPHQGDCQYGDILCVSDFGWMPIYEETMNLIAQEKEKNMKFYGLNIGDRSHRDICGIYNCLERIGTPADVCDSLWEYQDGMCKEIIPPTGLNTS